MSQAPSDDESPMVPRQAARATVFSSPERVETLAALIEAHGTLYAWAANQPQPHALRGRAPVYVASLPNSREQIVVRHAWHGGVMAPLTRDLFRPPSRAPREVDRSRTLRRLGIPTTEVIGYALYPALPGLVRVDVLSTYVADTADLGMVLARLAPGFDTADALSAANRLLTRLADHGVVHPDLNVKNILLRRSTADALEALVIDVDVVQIGLSPRHEAMRRNVARLVRSLHKWKRQFGGAIGDAEISRFATQALTQPA